MKKRIVLLCAMFLSLTFAGCGIDSLGGGGGVGIVPVSKSCGNGSVERPAEECDTAISAGQPGACPTEASCKAEGKLLADTECRAHCIQPPPPPVCGDRRVERPAEECDTGIAAGQPGACPTEAECLAKGLNYVGSGCLAKCGDPVACGNGKLDSGESCDTKIYDGVGKCPNEKTCHADGKVLVGTGCNAHCEDSLCGDGNVQAKDQGELCDTAITTGPLACPTEATCSMSGGTLVGKGCQVSCRQLCGNRYVDHGESCDTAIAGGPGECPTSTTCAATEKLINPGTCNAKCVPKTCGDGVKDAGEECDSTIAAGQPGACETKADCSAKTPASGKKWRYTGDPSSCDAKCEEVDLCNVDHFDGECPASCNKDNDLDCQYGKACDKATDCTSGSFGAKGLCEGGPGDTGMCTRECDPGDASSCPVGSMCMSIGTKDFCIKKCDGDPTACDTGVPKSFFCEEITPDHSLCIYRPTVAKMKNVGQACDTTNQSEMCGEEGVCLTSDDVLAPERTIYENGYCSADCSSKFKCDSESTCVGSATKATCLKNCIKDVDCQGGPAHGYQCLQIGAELGVCAPLRDACETDTKCDAAAHETCVAGVNAALPSRKTCAVVASGSAKIGETCNDVWDCEGGVKGVCIAFDAPPATQRVCSRLCKTSADCGDTSMYDCVDYITRPHGRATQKYCTKKCKAAGQCNGVVTGLTCNVGDKQCQPKAAMEDKTLQPREMGGGCAPQYGLFCNLGDTCLKNNCTRECDPNKADACPAASDCLKVTVDGEEKHLCLAQCKPGATECEQNPNVAVPAFGGTPMTCQTTGDAKDHCFF